MPADVVIVTAEDPRTEDLDGIIAESVAAAAGQGKVEGERRVLLLCAEHTFSGEGIKPLRAANVKLGHAVFRRGFDRTCQ